MRRIKFFGAGLLLFGLIGVMARVHAGSAREGVPAFQPVVLKTWDDAALADWATPIAGLNVRPTPISAKEYYSLRVENVRTYPVYYPGREPEGYWETLQHIGPKPLIEPEKLKSEADWIEAGRIAFDEADDLHLRNFDRELIAAARSRTTFEQAQTQPYPDGTLDGVRWYPPIKVSPFPLRVARIVISSPYPMARRSPAPLPSLRIPVRTGANTETP